MGHIDQKLLPTAADVEGAVTRLKGVAVRTPLINAPVLDERLGARVFLKAETGAAPASSRTRRVIMRRALPQRPSSSACAPPS